jgi:hypothetical protein
MSERLMTEREFVEELRREYQARGFTELDPKRVAESLDGAYEPDFAFKLGNLVDVIELKAKRRPQTATQIRKLRKIVEARPNWRFRFLVVPKRPAALPTINAEESVPRRLAAARDLARSDRELAIIQLWLVIEICLRRLLEACGEHPLPDANAMEMARSLRSLGELTDDDLQLLEKGYRARNHAMHGFQLPRDQMPPAGLFDFAQELCARAGIDLAGPKRVAGGRL